MKHVHSLQRLFRQRRRSAPAATDTTLYFWSEKLPLAAAMVAQCFVVATWYIGKHAPEPVPAILTWANVVVAVAAGLALDLVVVTTVMARRKGRRGVWGILTAAAAAIASSLIALDVYGGWSPGPYLHITYPVVVFLFSMHLSSPRTVVLNRPLLAQRRTLIVRLVQRLRTARAELHIQATTIARQTAQAAQHASELAQARTELAQRTTEMTSYNDAIARVQDEAAQASVSSKEMSHRVAQLQQQLAQRDTELNDTRAALEETNRDLCDKEDMLTALARSLPLSDDLDIIAIAQRLRDLDVSWRDIETLLHTPQSTLRHRMKARTNGHLVEA